MKRNPFSLIKTILHLTGHILGGIFAPAHQRVQQRKALAATPTPTQTIPLASAEITVLQVSKPVDTERSGAQLNPTESIPIPELIPQPSVESLADSLEPKTAPDRQQLVIMLLDEAYSIGHKTYPALIGYVKKHTGTGCSRRVVSAWKRSRNLMGEEVA